MLVAEHNQVLQLNVEQGTAGWKENPVLGNFDLPGRADQHKDYTGPELAESSPNSVCTRRSAAKYNFI